ncbi:hypothetical protein [Streptomyces sp. NPDC012888]|uniref:hypothetical protein n=1 Tax=Streptomyces sp. NPDC012888 TaxID=3364855 RepID=UPI0036CC04AE
MKKNQRIIASVVLAGALVGAGAPMASAAGPATAPAKVQVVDSHRAVTSAAGVDLSPASAPATGAATGAASAGAGAVSPEQAQFGKASWIIGKLRSLGGAAWKKITDAARAGWTKFKQTYERVVPWIVRKAISVAATVYEVYSIVRDFIF